jgi:aspartyl aminopeptidase
MSKTAIAMMLGLLLAMPATAQEPGKAAATPADAAASEPSVEQVLTEFRDQMQNVEADVLAKGLTLSADEAAKFWPVFERYQAEREKIIDGQIAAIRTYADAYATQTDDDAVAYVSALLERDQKIHDLRVKYLAEFTRVIGPGRAARVIHISRRLGLAGQAKLATAIPLVR